MSERIFQCQFGQRKKAGKVIHPPTCRNRASGVFKVHYKKGPPGVMLLCAHCAFVAMPNRVRMFVPQDDSKDVVFYRDVEGCELIKSLTTAFNQEAAQPGVGAKHWVADTKKELESIPGVTKVTIIPPRGKVKGRNMDMTQYFNSLRRHDDGK